MSFSEKLKEYRTQFDFTQDELAEKIGASQKTISSWETGRSEPTIKEFVKLCDLFNCTLASLSDTREKDVGDITIEDIYVKIKNMSLEELKKLDYEVKDRIKLVIEVEETRREHDKMVEKLKEYEKRLRELEKK